MNREVMMRFQPSSALSRAGVAGALLAVAILYTFFAWDLRAAAQRNTGTRHFTVRGNQYAFDPPRIEIIQDDVVAITFEAEDIPHSFTLDEYRISKRAAAGQSVTFQFRADRAGSFQFYCDLRFDQGCREMHGQLVVRPH